MNLTRSSLIACLITVSCVFLTNADINETDDYYELLGVPRNADNKDIRKAFKKIAVKIHPDKNKDDKDADMKFIKVARAYEILKDPDTRKEYDLYGDKGFVKGQKYNYQSYTYYRDQFDIYEDDPVIVTLSRAEYESNIIDSSQPWFVNFYSPNCHLCHELAPTWRKVAAELEGVIRFGAVNCEEDWVLCSRLSIKAYPTLLYYDKEYQLDDGVSYEDSRTFNSLQEYILSRVTARVQEVDRDKWQGGLRKLQWLLLLCANDNILCPEEENRIKLVAALDGLMPVGLITDPELCDEISKEYNKKPVVFWQVDEKTQENEDVTPQMHSIVGSDFKEIVDRILNLLPHPETLNEERFQDIRTKLRVADEKPWLICFYLGAATELSIQLKRLPALLPTMNIGLIHCARSASLCATLHVSHYPEWGVLKEGGAFELHHGRDTLHEIAAFARDSSKSTNLHALSPADFYNIVKGGKTWFIDWYAPWCPPCQKLMPELRRASQQFAPNVLQFGTIDCTQHTQLCSKEGVKSYPMTMLYNGSETHYFHGVPNENGIVEFLKDMINSPVITLDDSSFVKLMRKPVNEVWLVDFFAPWCGPCQRFAPEWRSLAKQVSHVEQVKVAQVDCVANADLCSSQNVRGYPTIRLYPLGSKGLNTVAIYNGQRVAVHLKNWLYSFLPSPVEKLTRTEFKNVVLSKKNKLPWLIDFYTSWCDHCTNFEPDFAIVAQKLENQIKSGKVDCEVERSLCQELHVSTYPTVILYLSPLHYNVIYTQVPDEIIQQVTAALQQQRSHYVHDEF